MYGFSWLGFRLVPTGSTGLVHGCPETLALMPTWCRDSSCFGKLVQQSMSGYASKPCQNHRCCCSRHTRCRSCSLLAVVIFNATSKSLLLLQHCCCCCRGQLPLQVYHCHHHDYHKGYCCCCYDCSFHCVAVDLPTNLDAIANCSFCSYDGVMYDSCPSLSWLVIV